MLIALKWILNVSFSKAIIKNVFYSKLSSDGDDMYTNVLKNIIIASW